jgi:outer membrane protein insertion porin family
MRFFFGHIGVFGSRFESNSAAFIGGTPLFARFYLGGEESIRGYNVRSISPISPIRIITNRMNVFALDLATGRRLRVRPAEQSTFRTVTPEVIEPFLEATEQTSLFPFPVGGDTQLLFNLEYRIPLFGPVSFAPFFDIGSAFNLRKLEDQFITPGFDGPTSLLGLFQTITINPRGQLATQREIRQARTPESQGGLPQGFRFIDIQGDVQQIQRLALSEAQNGLLDNYKYSLGGELRVQVPVINVPFRLIFAWNPNARVDPTNLFFFEEKRVIRFSIGRTF